MGGYGWAVVFLTDPMFRRRPRQPWPLSHAPLALEVQVVPPGAGSRAPVLQGSAVQLEAIGVHSPYHSTDSPALSRP
jgi:hypothetical protein